MKPNVFKQKLRSGEPQIGMWVALANSYTAEICAGAGFDWLLLDGEHAPNDVRSVLGQLQAIAPYPVSPVVRPVAADPNLIKQLLDIGVTTFLVPMVEDAAQAAALVRAMRYPPQGVRGVGSSLARAAQWGRVPHYLRDAGDEMCLLVQIETRKGIDNLDEIARVPGVDGVFIGPSDLAADLGHIGLTTHPDVMKVIDAAIVAIRRAGKSAGILAMDEGVAAGYLDAGVGFIATTTDVGLLARGAERVALHFANWKQQRAASRARDKG